MVNGSDGNLDHGMKQSTEEFIRDSKPRRLTAEEIEAVRNQITPVEQIPEHSIGPRLTMPECHYGSQRRPRPPKKAM